MVVHLMEMALGLKGTLTLVLMLKEMMDLVVELTLVFIVDWIQVGALVVVQVVEQVIMYQRQAGGGLQAGRGGGGDGHGAPTSNAGLGGDSGPSGEFSGRGRLVEELLEDVCSSHLQFDNHDKYY